MTVLTDACNLGRHSRCEGRAGGGAPCECRCHGTFADAVRGADFADDLVTAGIAERLTTRDWVRMYLLAKQTWDDTCMGVWRTIADGGSLLDVTNYVAEVMDNNDCVDAESTAAFEAAKAVAST